MRRLDWFFLISCLCALPLAGCGSDDSPAIDAAPRDAALDAAPDGSADAGLCAGLALFTGSYVDWDGNSEAPTNTIDTLVSEDGSAQNSVRITAPNGRVVLCVSLVGANLAITFTHPDYLPLRYTFNSAAAGTAFDIRGLTPARADELFTTLGVTRDPAVAQVMVAVRREAASPEAVGAAVTGARVSLGNASAGSFTADGNGTYGAGDTLDGDAFVLFTNTELGGGTTAVTVTPPQGVTCVGPDSIAVAAGEIAVTTFACTGS